MTRENLIKLQLGFDYIVITANPKTGITNRDILVGINAAAEILGDDTVIIAGRCTEQAAGTFDPQVIRDFAGAGRISF